MGHFLKVLSSYAWRCFLAKNQIAPRPNASITVDVATSDMSPYIETIFLRLATLALSNNEIETAILEATTNAVYLNTAVASRDSILCPKIAPLGNLCKFESSSNQQNKIFEIAMRTVSGQFRTIISLSNLLCELLLKSVQVQKCEWRYIDMKGERQSRRLCFKRDRSTGSR